MPPLDGFADSVDYADCDVVSLDFAFRMIPLTGRCRLSLIFDTFLVKKHGINYTLRLSWLGLKLDPLLTLRCSVAQSQQGAALSEPHESRRVIPFYPLACLGHMISNGRRMAVTRQRFEVFRFPVMQSTFCFPNIAIITTPAASLINYDWMQETTQRIIKLFGLLLPDLLVKKCSYQTSL